jgi:UDP-glucose 4-epimerase
MQVLVTGGSGFIGSHLVDRLSADGRYKVIVIDNFQTGFSSNLIENSEVKICEGDVSDPNFIENVFIKYRPRIVIHTAASYKDPSNWKVDIETNIVGMVNLITFSKKHSILKFINLQTSLCYGLDPISFPVKIGDPYFNGSYCGGSSYAVSKTAGELYLSLSGLNFISFRLANVYGPRNFSGPIPAFYSNLMKNTKSKIYKGNLRQLF